MDSILITGFFRTGSTLLFSALRQCAELQVFYEPYHPDILNYVAACQAGLPNADRERLGHTVDGDYFEEYRNINLDEMDQAFNLRARILNHPVLTGKCKNKSLKKYVTFLHDHAKENKKIPVLQANRLNFCFDWFSNNFPNNYNILITRNPYEIFLSLQKLAKKDGLELKEDTEALDYWNVLSIFNALKARYPFIESLNKGYFYKLCFVVEWINRIESRKANLVIPYEKFSNSGFSRSTDTVFRIFHVKAKPINEFITEKYSESSPLKKNLMVQKIEEAVRYQIDEILSRVNRL